jgi:hypothetical protein
LLTASLGVAPFSQAQAIREADPVTEDDRNIYNTLYGEKLSSVQRTRSNSDDRTLVQEMMGFAKTIPDDTGVRCLIYIDAVKLASDSAELDLMLDAAEGLRSLWPEHPTLKQENLLDLASRGYRAAPRTDRKAVGEDYIALLLSMAQDLIEADDYEQATSLCRLASTVARSIDSDQRERIETTLDFLDIEGDLASRIKMLRLSVEKNPQNRPAARELVDLLVAKRNDPATALTYVESTGDEELIDLVQRAAAGRDAANAASAMRVADWYIALAKDLPDRYALPLLLSARQWHARFFELYDRGDALSMRANAMDQANAARIDALRSENPDAAEATAWRRLTDAPYDVNEHLVDRPDSVQADNGEISINDGNFVVPVEPADAYEVRITLTTIEAEQFEERSIDVKVPIGSEHEFEIRHFGKGGVPAKLDDVEGESLLRDVPDRIGKRVTLVLQVKRTGDDIAFAMLFNGRAALRWQGAMEELEEVDPNRYRRLPEDIGPVISIRAFTPVIVHSVEYREQ